MLGTKSFAATATFMVLFMLGLAAEVLGVEATSLTGLLLQDSEGAMELQTQDFTYLVQGNLPESLVGKTVVLSGRLARGEQGTRWIIVTEYIEKSDTANGSGK